MMDQVFDPLNLLILAVAVVVFLRLRSVLGKRTGNERPPFDPYAGRRAEARTAAEDARHATIAAVKATADVLATNLAQMQFLENSRDVIKQLAKRSDPGDVQ